MKIDPSEKYDQEVFSILQKIKYEQSINKSNIIIYSIKLHPLNGDSITKQLIVHNLEDRGLIKILDSHQAQVGKRSQTVAFLQLRLQVQEPVFSRYYSKYKRAFELTRKTKIKIYSNGKVELKAHGKKYFAKFRVGSDTYKVLVLLASRWVERVEFDEIGKLLRVKPVEAADERRARDTIQYIKRKLNYKGNDFIVTDYGFKLVCDVEFVK